MTEAEQGGSRSEPEEDQPDDHCDAYVQAQVDEYRDHLQNDARRQAAFVLNATARFHQLRGLRKAEDPRVISDLTYKLQMNAEQFARVTQLDIKTPVDASRLTTAVDIIAYITQCLENAKVAEKRLQKHDPEEFKKLMNQMGPLQSPLLRPLSNSSSPGTLNSDTLPPEPTTISPPSSGSVDEAKADKSSASTPDT